MSSWLIEVDITVVALRLWFLAGRLRSSLWLFCCSVCIFIALHSYGRRNPSDLGVQALRLEFADLLRAVFEQVCSGFALRLTGESNSGLVVGVD
jgi:hypothetical protein